MNVFHFALLSWAISTIIFIWTLFFFSVVFLVDGWLMLKKENAFHTIFSPLWYVAGVPVCTMKMHTYLCTYILWPPIILVCCCCTSWRYLRTTGFTGVGKFSVSLLISLTTIPPWHGEERRRAEHILNNFYSSTTTTTICPRRKCFF